MDDKFYGIPQYTKTEQFQQTAEQFKFRSVHSYLNDVKYSSLKEVPLDQMTKREVENLLVLPREEDIQTSVEFKPNRILFFGYGREIMEDTLKAVAVEHHWLFQEIDLSEIIIHFLRKNPKDDELESGDQGQVRNLFLNAAKESKKKNLPYLLLFKNIEDILVDSSVYDEGIEFIEKVRKWLFEQLNQYLSMKEESGDNRFSEAQPDLICVFVSNNPVVMREDLLQKLVQKAIYFDFPDLRALKLLLAQEILHLNSHLKQQQYIDEQGQYNQVKDQNSQNTNNQDYISEYPYRRYHHYDDIYDDDQYYEDNGDGYIGNVRFSSKTNQNQNFLMNFQQKNEMTSYKDQIDHDNRLIRQVLHRRDPQNQEKSSFIQIEKTHYRKAKNKIENKGKQYNHDIQHNERDSNEEDIHEDNKSVYSRHVSLGYQRKCSAIQRKLHYFQVIIKNGIKIVIEKRKNLEDKFTDNLLSDDNVVMIRGQRVCIVFDGDFDTYLMDHALPIREKTSNYNKKRRIQEYSIQKYEKPGLIEEDIRNLLKVCINLQIFDQKNQRSLQRDYLEEVNLDLNNRYNKESNDDNHEGNSNIEQQDDQINQQERRARIMMRENQYEPFYVISEEKLKNGFLNYQPLLNLKQSNQILQWAKVHINKVTQLQALSSSVSEYLIKHPYINPDHLDLNLIRQTYLNNQIDQAHQNILDTPLVEPLENVQLGLKISNDNNRNDIDSLGNLEQNQRTLNEHENDVIINEETCNEATNQIEQLKEKIRNIRQAQINNSNQEKDEEQIKTSSTNDDILKQLEQKLEISLQNLNSKLEAFSLIQNNPAIQTPPPQTDINQLTYTKIPYAQDHLVRFSKYPQSSSYSNSQNNTNSFSKIEQHLQDHISKIKQLLQRPIIQGSIDQNIQGKPLQEQFNMKTSQEHIKKSSQQIPQQRFNFIRNMKVQLEQQQQNIFNQKENQIQRELTQLKELQNLNQLQEKRSGIGARLQGYDIGNKQDQQQNSFKIQNNNR